MGGRVPVGAGLGHRVNLGDLHFDGSILSRFGGLDYARSTSLPDRASGTGLPGDRTDQSVRDPISADESPDWTDARGTSRSRPSPCDGLSVAKRVPHFRQRVPYGVAWNIGNWENCTYFRSSEAGSRLLAGGNSLRRSVLGISRMVLFDVRFRFPGARAHNSTIRGSLDVGPTIQWLGRGPSGSAAPLGLRT